MKMKLMFGTLFVAAATLTTAFPAAAQAPTPGSIEEARRQAREEAQRAREAAQRARDAQQRLREQEAQLRRARREEARGPEFTETFSRTVRIGRNGTFDLSSIAGNITVTGGGGDDAKIDAIKRVRQAGEQSARELLQAIDIQVTERGNGVEVRTEFPRNQRNWSGGVDYTIALPLGASVSLRSISSDMRITNVRGELRAETVSGDIVASAIGRLRSVRTISGDLTLTNVEGEDVTAGTVSGDLASSNLKARSIDFQAVSGNLQVTDTDAERLSIRTISGDIALAGRLGRSGRYELMSQSGDIRLTPGDDVGFTLEADSFSGELRSDLPFTAGGSVTTTGRTGRPGRGGPRNQALRGTIGNGGATVTARSFSGNILITRR